jgi:hypothetical protein
MLEIDGVRTALAFKDSAHMDRMADFYLRAVDVVTDPRFSSAQARTIETIQSELRMNDAQICAALSKSEDIDALKGVTNAYKSSIQQIGELARQQG